MNATSETLVVEPLALPDVTPRLAAIYADAQRELTALLADRPIARDVVQLEDAIVAANQELVTLDSADLGDDANAAAHMLGRGVLLRRRIETLVAQRMAMTAALDQENSTLRARLATVTRDAQRVVDADLAAVRSLAAQLDAWRAPRVPIEESRPWEQPRQTPEQERRALEVRLGVA